MKSIKFTPLFINTTVSRYIVPAIILLHLGITITLSKIQNLWVDEAYSLHTTQYSIGHAFSRALSFEEQPPTYFVLLNLWRNMNNSYFFARLFSVLWICLALLVFATMSQKLLKDIHPGWITAVVAFNPFIIWAATEIRVYALVILISTLLCKFFWDGYLSENPMGSAKWYYGLLSVFALYTFYFLGFLLVANACALLVLKRWRSFRTYLITMLGVALCFAPMMWVVPNQVSHAASTGAQGYGIWEGLTWVASRILVYIIPNEGEFFSLARKLVLFIGIIVVMFYLLRKKHNIIMTPIIAYLTTVSILYIFNVIIFIFLFFGDVNAMGYRYMSYIFPPLFLCVFFILVTFLGKKVVIIGSLILLFFNVSAGIVQFTSTPKPGDWARIAAYLMGSEKPCQPVLVYRSESALPLAFHYSGINNIVPIPRRMNLETYDLVYDNVLKDEITISEILSGALNDCQSFWLVTDNGFKYRGVRFSHALLVDFISQNYTVLTTKNFYGAKVRFVQIIK